MLRAFAILTALTLGGCGGSGNADAGGVTPAEAEALNHAAEQLDRQAPPPRIEPQAVPARK